MRNSESQWYDGKFFSCNQTISVQLHDLFLLTASSYIYTHQTIEYVKSSRSTLRAVHSHCLWKTGFSICLRLWASISQEFVCACVCSPRFSDTIHAREPACEVGGGLVHRKGVVGLIIVVWFEWFPFRNAQTTMRGLTVDFVLALWICACKRKRKNMLCIM